MSIRPRKCSAAFFSLKGSLRQYFIHKTIRAQDKPRATPALELTIPNTRSLELGLGPRGSSCFLGTVSPVHSLIEYLQQLARSGERYVRLDEEAKEILRERIRKGKRSVEAGPRHPPVTKAVDIGSGNSQQTEAPPSKLKAEGGSAIEKLASLRKQAETWEPALSLSSLRDTMVFATGNPEAELMLVGEAPGYEEERRGQPFVGKAGQKLDQILMAMGFSRESVYISNICKFRPALKNQTTNNRKPTPLEMQACLPFVRAEIEIVRPKCIIALGGTAAEGLLNYENQPVGRMREQWHEFEGIPLRVTYHPSYLLHNDSAVTEKRKVWEDMLSVMELLEMPISQKQRAFFAKK